MTSYKQWLYHLCLFLLLFALSGLVACQPKTEDSSSVVADIPAAEDQEPMGEESSLLDTIPETARITTRQGQPRARAYWAVWNSCAPNNRAEQAAANGGRAAGWFLLDDLIANPGIQLGEHPVSTCAEGVALLQADKTGEELDDRVTGLAGALFAAELNLNAGAETCTIIEEVVVAAHILLTEIGFDGREVERSVISTEIDDAMPQITQLLELYNRGELCR